MKAQQGSIQFELLSPKGANCNLVTVPFARRIRFSQMVAGRLWVKPTYDGDPGSSVSDILSLRCLKQTFKESFQEEAAAEMNLVFGRGGQASHHLCAVS